MPTDDPDELLKVARAGDQAAVGRLLELIRPAVRKFLAMAKLRRREDAKDLEQEIMLRALRALPRFRGETSFLRYVLGIAANVVRNYLTRDVREYDRIVSLEQIPTEDGPGLQRNAELSCLVSMVQLKILGERLWEVAHRVCKRDERLVLFMDAQGHTSTEIEANLKLNRSTVRSHLRRGRAKILAYLVAYRPDLLDGPAVIRRALDLAKASPDPGHRPTPAEEAALFNPKQKKTRDFKRACLKLAPFLWVIVSTGE